MGEPSVSDDNDKHTRGRFILSDPVRGRRLL
jgi:hypothetical protein